MLVENKHSEVTRLIEQIQSEHRIVLTALEELAEGTAKHRFLAKRLETMRQHQYALVPLVGVEQAQVLATKAKEEA